MTDGVVTAPKRRRWVKPAVTVLALIAIASVSRRIIVPGLANLGHPQWGWLPAAVVAQAASMGAFARLQRRALAVGGIRIPLISSIAIAYGGNAFSVTVPVAGSTTAVAFTASRFSRHGAPASLVTWTLAMTGLISTTALVAIVGLGGLLAGNSSAALAGAIAAGVGAVPLVALFVALRSAAARPFLQRTGTVAVSAAQRLVRRPRGDPAEVTARTIDQLLAYRLDARSVSALVAFASLNWLADIACLAAAIAFVGEPVPWSSITLIYAAAVAAAAIGFTPAGIGIVETAIAASLTATGIAGSSALPAAIVYRGISCWLVLLVGWVVVARSRHGSSPAPSSSGQA